MLIKMQQEDQCLSTDDSCR